MKKYKKGSEVEKAVIDMNVDLVKIIGTLKGTKEKIELVMDEGVFFEWLSLTGEKK